MSKIEVNELAVRSGNDITFNNTVKIDTLKGKTAAGSIDVTGEGNSTTTNLQQGLTKWFATHRGDFSNAVEDSFNVASHTDTGTGGVRYTFTNNMGNTGYCPHVNGINGDHLISTQADVTASSCRFGHYNQSNGLTDPGFSSHSAVGDLA